MLIVQKFKKQQKSAQIKTKNCILKNYISNSFKKENENHQEIIKNYYVVRNTGCTPSINS